MTQPSYYGQTQQGTPYGQPIQNQPSYGQPLQEPPYGQPYGRPGYGQPFQPPYSQPSREHPQASTVLLLAVIGIPFAFAAYVAWYLGSKAKREIEAGAPYIWGGSIKIGYILAVVVSIIQIIFISLYILSVILFGFEN